MHTNLTFHASSDIVVVGTNPEMVDFDNPRGNVYGFSSYVVATDEQGNRTRLYVTTSSCDRDALEEAERLAARLTLRLQVFKKLPVAFDRWEPTFAAYGSAAHDEDELIAWERRVEEDACFS